MSMSENVDRVVQNTGSDLLASLASHLPELTIASAQASASEAREAQQKTIIDGSTERLQRIPIDEIIDSIKERVKTGPNKRGVRQVYFKLGKNHVSPETPYFQALQQALLKQSLVSGVYLTDLEGRRHGHRNYGKAPSVYDEGKFGSYYLRINLAPFDQELNDENVRKDTERIKKIGFRCFVVGKKLSFEWNKSTPT